MDGTTALLREEYMKRIVEMVSVVLLISLLFGCGSNSKSNNAFVGSWHTDSSYANYTFEFKKDGTVEINDGGEIITAKWETGETDIQSDGKDLHFRTLEIKAEEGTVVYLYSDELKENDAELEILTYDNGTLYSEFKLIRD